MHDTKKTTAITLFAVIIVILQLISTFINFGSFPITLTLIPIIVGGAIFGPLAGCLLGLVFGIIVALMVVLGADPSGATMFATRPIVTVSVCLLKGALAGLISGIVYHLFKKKNEKLAIILSSAIAPIVNTGTLYLCLYYFFGAELRMLVGALMSFNFFLELITNILLAPGLLSLIHKGQETY
ncbi:MAG: ECF transporter S component [Erysipelotrichaceae bacterium]|nr:ECF transporter S component [Erysipelotrichaceae bacterium]